MGEKLAAWFLQSHGLRVVASNVPVGRGELDLIAQDGKRLVAVEVRTVTSPGDPIDAIDPAKRRQVGSLAARVGIDRIDYVGVGLGPRFIDFHWVPGSN